MTESEIEKDNIISALVKIIEAQRKEIEDLKERLEDIQKDKLAHNSETLAERMDDFTLGIDYLLEPTTKMTAEQYKEVRDRILKTLG